MALVLEYIERDLKKILDQVKGRGLDEPTVKSYLTQLLTACAHIHQNKTLHRDLKPSNLLITTAGTLKVADMGLARAFGIPVAN